MTQRVTSTNWQEDVQRVADGIRRRVLQYTVSNNGGYLSQACSSAEIFATLYTKIMKLGPSAAPLIPPPFPGVPGPHNPDYLTGAAYNGPKAPHLDRFILSPSHYALVLYATLVEVGRMASEGLAMFNQDGSSVEMIAAEHSPGNEVMGGSLAQAISQGAGIAYARKKKGDTGRVWIFLSDGEFQEGQTWEAIQSMAFFKLDNVGIYVDVNGQQCDGKTEEVMTIEPLVSRLEAFGARPISVNGHDIEALAQAAALPPDGRPLVVLAYTNPCQCLPFLEERRPLLHYVRFKSEEERRQYAEILANMEQAEGVTL
ncbi:MAG: thiamine pyrophosphate-dependent enzyme [Chloroflexota bacterium]